MLKLSHKFALLSNYIIYDLYDTNVIETICYLKNTPQRESILNLWRVEKGVLINSVYAIYPGRLKATLSSVISASLIPVGSKPMFFAVW